jgi:hypothetical protein
METVKSSIWGLDARQWQDNFLFCTTSKPTLRPTQIPTTEASFPERKQPVCEVNFFPHLLKVKFSLEQAMKAQGGGEVQIYSFFNLGARFGKGGG